LIFSYSVHSKVEVTAPKFIRSRARKAIFMVPF
jgi:hypothetical protein